MQSWLKIQKLMENNHTNRIQKKTHTYIYFKRWRKNIWQKLNTIPDKNIHQTKNSN